VSELDGVWAVKRTGGLLPPLVGIRKDIHGTRGKTPATTRTMKITAAATAQVSKEKRGALRRARVLSAIGVEDVGIVRAP